GIFNKENKPIDSDKLIDMTRTLVHRGPDEEGFFINDRKRDGWKIERVGEIVAGNGNVGLGHRRLSIIDLSSGQQPLCNENATIWITFNGEIYNFNNLMLELESLGHRFATRSDTETIVHAYEQWGADCLKKLRGMFAFAIWDENKKEMFLARDRVGKKPIYYYEDKECVLFASEIKAILQKQKVSRKIDFSALSDYFSLNYIPAPKSIFESIKKLPAAHYMVINNNSIRIKPYWDLSFYPEHDISEQKMIDGLMGILTESTKIRMISEVPLGAFLSGGVDSSGIVALMAEASEDPVKTNSISFREAAYNEAPFARQVAELFKTDHHEFNVTPEAVSVIEKLAWHYDEPFADSSAVPTFYVSETARKNVTVALSGDGGDENFAGYRRYWLDMRENMVRNVVPQKLREPIFGTIGRLFPKADYLPQIFRGKAFISNVARDPVGAYFFSVSAMYNDTKNELLHPDVKKAISGYDTRDIFYQYYNNAPAEDHLSKIQYLDIKTYLCDDILTKVDRASMAVSLEVRCPILDHEFMEYVAKIPSKMKLQGTEGKVIFKKAFKRYLPDDILYRKKMGFGVPILEWLRGELHDYAKPLILDGQATRNLLHRPVLEKMWSEHQSKIRNRATELWQVMMLNLWYDRFAE
ncbi:MAG: asparagine synthase (glutamine-hydrolyzing), partial [Desulfobacterium sp.]|nr:asparagine synthase (glutamine-hydrolyzing) [Desulfobacterium sp.]